MWADTLARVHPRSPVLLCSALLAALAAGCRATAPREGAPTGPTAQVRCASLPGALGLVAIHCWFVCWDVEEGRWRRWEVWQVADAGGESWGHVHRDLLPPDTGVGGGAYEVLHEWTGEEAARLSAALAASPEYPERDRYHAWPGPNSNTYVAWVLRRAGLRLELPPSAVGKEWLGVIGAAASTTRTGVQAGSPLIGLKVGLLDGVEVHPFSLTVGVDFVPPAIKTPFGRIGFPE